MSFAVRVRFIDFGSFYVFAYSSSAISQLTVPIPCEGSYCRTLVALSISLSPLWLGLYLLNRFNVNVWGSKIGDFEICPNGWRYNIANLRSECLLTTSKHSAGDVKLEVLSPYYFILRTGFDCPLWICDCRHVDWFHRRWVNFTALCHLCPPRTFGLLSNFIPDHLVGLLEFLGIVAGIPNYIMGLSADD